MPTDDKLFPVTTSAAPLRRGGRLRALLPLILVAGATSLLTRQYYARMPLKLETAVCTDLQDVWRSEAAWDPQSLPLPSKEVGSILHHTPARPHPSSPRRGKRMLNGPPTAKFRDNLRDDVKYITTFHDAGWTNDVIMIANMIHLGQLTGRVPVIPPFIPLSLHVEDDAGDVAFGDVFDLPRFTRLTGTQAVDWWDVKKENSKDMEEFGCWSPWYMIEQRPRGGDVPFTLSLDVSYTPTPSHVLLGSDSHSTFWGLSTLAFPEGRRDALRKQSPMASQEGRIIAPDEHLLCYDFLYYASSEYPYEFKHEWSPVWHSVITHLRWTNKVSNLRDAHLRHMFGLSPNQDVPPYIAVHMRRGDFLDYCKSDDPTVCLPDMSAMVSEVVAVQRELASTKNVHVEDTHVIVTSDEKDPKWWEEVRALGWHAVDHAGMRTAKDHGKWYEVFIDAAIQAGGMGFVGTFDSTMSILAMRRVEDWQNGIGRLVEWSKTAWE